MENKSVNIIKEEFENADESTVDRLIELYMTDSRKSVVSLAMRYKKKKEAQEKEIQRIQGMKVYERKYDFCEYICGIDEVGRGPFAGPVVTAAVIMPKDCIIPGVNDSKKLSEEKREELFEIITQEAIEYSIGQIESDEIDRINILNATKKAMTQSVNNLEHRPGIILIDALTLPEITIKQEAIIKGDAKSFSIAAASIVAKVTRDRLMKEYDKMYPQYGFARNKGYGTAEHSKAILEYGPCPIHRRSFIKNLLNS